MFELNEIAASSKGELYAKLAEQLRHLLEGERDFIANAANFASLLYHTLPDLNWAGFYLNRGGDLVLGPFQGKPACVRIHMGKGVCGRAAEDRSPVVVPDVNEFPGHIACDSASRSEVVVPIVLEGELVGVLDLDSPYVGRFDDDDREGLEELVEIFLGATSVTEY